MFLKNTWYVAGWSQEITAQSPLPRTILGVPVVLWRDAQGKVSALPDRCPHRGAPLSKGRIEGSELRCMYHGMKFDAQGACTHIPGQERIPPGANLSGFPVVERNKWVWIWMGEADKADASLIPDTYWLDSPQWRYKPGGNMHYDVNYLLIADNLLDFSHLPFVHEKTLGGSADYANTRADVKRLDNGLRVERWFMDAPPAPFVKDLTGWTQNVDRWNIYDFVVPGVLLMDSGSAPAGGGAREGNREGGVQFRSAQALTPETETSTHYFYSQAHNFALDDPSVTEKLHATVVAGFKEDWEMIHAQAHTLSLDPGFKMMPLNVDNALGHFRWLMGRLISTEQTVARAA